MEFPRLVVRPGGTWQLETGMYSLLQVNTPEALEAAIADGWLADQYATAMPAAVPVPASEILPPSMSRREQLEATARALDIPFNARTTDATLEQRIAAKG